MGRQALVTLVGLVLVVSAGLGEISKRTVAAAVPHRPAVTSQHHGALGLHVNGNQIVNSNGQRVRLTGFNNSGAEYACMEGWGIFDVKSGDNTAVPATDVAAMASWKGANAVRLQLNEQCWLGIGGVKPQYAGANYQHAIVKYVDQLTSRGFAVILNLHLSAPGKEPSYNQEAMPDRHSLAFWRSVGAAFKDNDAVLFDLYNEPWPDNQSQSTTAWRCWRDGGCETQSVNGSRQYRAIGMNQLIDAVRSTGARNIVLVGGVNYASSLNHWLAYMPSDPDHELAASIHIYSFNGCVTTKCFSRQAAAVARRVPLVIGELGPDLTVSWSPSLNSSCPSSYDGTTGFDDRLLRWARRHGASWTAWTWNPWRDCWALVKNFRGDPTHPYGVTIKRALAAHPSPHRA